MTCVTLHVNPHTTEALSLGQNTLQEDIFSTQSARFGALSACVGTPWQPISTTTTHRWKEQPYATLLPGCIFISMPALFFFFFLFLNEVLKTSACVLTLAIQNLVGQVSTWLGSLSDPVFCRWNHYLAVLPASVKQLSSSSYCQVASWIPQSLPCPSQQENNWQAGKVHLHKQ